MTEDLAAITCFFSYVKNSHSVQRYKEFRDNLERQGVKLFTIELAFFDEDFLLEDDIYLKVRTDTVLWHKESLLNILASRLPPNIRKIAWLDCDIFIEDDNWSDKASKLLQEYKVIQIGSKNIYLDREGKEERSPMTSGYGYHHKKGDWKNFSKYHPGLAWAARRELFEHHGGLFRYCVSGGADGLMSNLFGSRYQKTEDEEMIPEWKHRIYLEGCPTIINRIKEYRNRAVSYIDGSMSYLEGSVTHRYHAPSSRRGYLARPKILKGIDFYKDLSEDKNDLFTWRDMRYNEVFKTFFEMKDSQNDGKVSYENVNLENILK